MPSLRVEGSIPLSNSWEFQGSIIPEKTPYNFHQPDHKGIKEIISFDMDRNRQNFRVHRISRVKAPEEDGSTAEVTGIHDLGVLKNGGTFFFAYNYIDEDRPRHNYPQVIRVTQI